MVCYVRACVRTYVRACARKCQASLQFEVTLGQARLWERPLHNPWDKPAARTGPLLGPAIGNASRQVRFFGGEHAFQDLLDRPALWDMPFNMLGTGPPLGHALQSPWDKPAIGIRTYVGTYVRTYVCPSEFSGQALSWDLPFNINGTNPHVRHALHNP